MEMVNLEARFTSGAGSTLWTILSMDHDVNKSAAGDFGRIRVVFIDTDIQYFRRDFPRRGHLSILLIKLLISNEDDPRLKLDTIQGLNFDA